MIRRKDNAFVKRQTAREDGPNACPHASETKVKPGMPSARRLAASLLILIGLAGLGAVHAAAAPVTAPAACAPADLAQLYPGLAGRTIRIGQDGQSAPFSLRDPKDFNHLIGLDADLARATFACIGVPVRFVTGAWSGLLPALMAGRIDAMWDTLLYTPERAKKVDFVVYMSSATGMLVPKGNPKKLHSLADFCGITAAAGLGTVQEAQLRRQSARCTAAGKAAIAIITTPDIPSGMRLVENGRADVLSDNAFIVEAMAGKSPALFTDAFSMRTNALIAVGLPKGDEVLARAIRDSLVILQTNGTERQIFVRNGVDPALALPPEILTK